MACILVDSIFAIQKGPYLPLQTKIVAQVFYIQHGPGVSALYSRAARPTRLGGLKHHRNGGQHI